MLISPQTNNSKATTYAVHLTLSAIASGSTSEDSFLPSYFYRFNTVNTLHPVSSVCFASSFHWDVNKRSQPLTGMFHERSNCGWHLQPQSSCLLCHEWATRGPLDTTSVLRSRGICPSRAGAATALASRSRLLNSPWIAQTSASGDKGIAMGFAQLARGIGSRMDIC